MVAVDPYTVKIKQGGPNAFFLLGLSLHPIYMFDAKEMQKHATEQDPWAHNFANTEGIAGFGPYCLERLGEGRRIRRARKPALLPRRGADRTHRHEEGAAELQSRGDAALGPGGP